MYWTGREVISVLTFLCLSFQLLIVKPFLQKLQARVLCASKGWPFYLCLFSCDLFVIISLFCRSWSGICDIDCVRDLGWQSNLLWPLLGVTWPRFVGWFQKSIVWAEVHPQCRWNGANRICCSPYNDTMFLIVLHYFKIDHFCWFQVIRCVLNTNLFHCVHAFENCKFA